MGTLYYCSWFALFKLLLFAGIGCNLAGVAAALVIPSMHDVVEVMGGTLSPLVNN